MQEKKCTSPHQRMLDYLAEGDHLIPSTPTAAAGPALWEQLSDIADAAATDSGVPFDDALAFEEVTDKTQQPRQLTSNGRGSST
ncbi:hypothetical protein [Streptomyces violarus]|uniref:hypothetical protein n=1 Tax=Streptomyces violarus TaxID=67380 RepID=UPI0021C13821|nr:hypothetical protein [Streptomyces violarus]MCT9141797.1 hypothetical protein [Streptomyces violarus]